MRLQTVGERCGGMCLAFENRVLVVLANKCETWTVEIRVTYIPLSFDSRFGYSTHSVVYGISLKLSAALVFQGLSDQQAHRPLLGRS